MEPLQQFKAWLSRRGVLVIIIALVILFWIPLAYSQKVQPRIVHTLGPSTQHVDVLWLIQDEISNLIATNASGTIFTMDLARDHLVTIDIKSGAKFWNKKLPFEQSDVRSLLANEHTLFVVTGIGVDAYDVTTGELKWSTKLGVGHVAVVSQFDFNIIRIYYGDKLYEINPETGEILTALAKENIVWVVNEIVLRETPTNKLIATNRQTTDEVLWINDDVPYIREDYKPRYIGDNELIIGFTEGVCMLNLEVGNYIWCHPDIDITKLTIDYQSQLVFGMRDDLVLLTMDLQTGSILGETRFLSDRPIDEQIGYFSSIVSSNGVVVVSFSDSGQTFGLEFTDLK